MVDIKEQIEEQVNNAENLLNNIKTLSDEIISYRNANDELTRTSGALAELVEKTLNLTTESHSIILAMKEIGSEKIIDEIQKNAKSLNSCISSTTEALEQKIQTLNHLLEDVNSELISSIKLIDKKQDSTIQKLDEIMTKIEDDKKFIIQAIDISTTKLITITDNIGKKQEFIIKNLGSISTAMEAQKNAIILKINNNAKRNLLSAIIGVLVVLIPVLFLLFK
jgi:hypothetical protein